MDTQDFKAPRRLNPDKLDCGEVPLTEHDQRLHKHWVAIPALIFALLAAVAVFGHAPETGPEAGAQAPVGDRL